METSRVDTLRRLVALSGYADRDRTIAIDRPLAQAAAREGLAPLLGRRHERGEIQVTEAAVGEELTRAYRRCVARNVRAEFALEGFYSALREQRVAPVLLKGGALVALVYDNPGERSMADVDLLVAARAWRDALAAARSAGAAILDDPDRRVTMSRYHEVHLRLADGVLVDLHRRLHSRPLFRIDHTGIMARSTATDAGYRLPEPNDLFVSLATHAAQDGFYIPARGLVDGLALAGHTGVLPTTVWRRARAWRARRATGLWLRMLERFGLATERWGEALAKLDPHGRLARAAADLPRLPLPLDAAQRRRLRWQMSRSLDSPTRAVGFFALRGTLLVGDWALRLVPQRKEARHAD